MRAFVFALECPGWWSAPMVVIAAASGLVALAGTGAAIGTSHRQPALGLGAVTVAPALGAPVLGWTSYAVRLRELRQPRSMPDYISPEGQATMRARGLDEASSAAFAGTALGMLPLVAGLAVIAVATRREAASRD